MTTRTGDIIHTVEELEALPDRSVILDRHGDAWQQTGTLQEGDTTQAAWLGSVPVSCRQSSAVDLPARVLHVPGEQEPTAKEVEAAMAALASSPVLPPWWGGRQFRAYAEAVLQAAKEARHG